jgi:uncharacterized protein (DUF2267 family)
MQYDEFIARVAELGGVERGDAERAVPAVLSTLADRIGPREAADTAAQLPKELKDALEPTDPNAGEFDAAEFLKRVRERAELDPEQARDLARAVLVTLREAVSEGELRDWDLLLSTDYVDLGARPADTGHTPRGAHAGTRRHAAVALTGDEFVRRVATRAGLDPGRAERAVDAALETLGERIAAGQAEDLATQLPERVAAPLLRHGGNAQPIPADQFVRRVADREGEMEPLAREHARAVLTTLREAVSADEWRDTVAELSRDYEALLGISTTP